jgi:predicted HTH transcriptional regulator
MNDAAIRARLYDKEDGWTERKSKGVSTEEIRKTIIAFANSLPEGQQGILFIGISDRTGEVEGVDDTDALQKNIRRAAEEKTYPPIRIGHNSRVLDENGKSVVAVIVDASQNRPHFAGPAYVRVGSESVEASNSQFQELIATRTSIARKILDAKRKDETVLVDERRRGYHPGRTQCKVESCDAHFANFKAVKEGWAYSASLSQITVSYVDMMGMLLFTLSDR